VFGSALSTLGTGNVVVEAGLMNFNVATSGTGVISVTGSGTVGGTGSLTQQLVASNGGTIAPGNSIGTLTAGNGILMSSGAILRMEVDLTSLTSDLLSVAGGIDISGSLLALDFLNPQAVSGSVFYLVVNDLEDGVVGDFGVPDGGFIINNDAYQVEISYDANSAGGAAGFAGGGNDIAIRVTSVPEPSVGLALLSGLGLLLGTRRSRREAGARVS
jgi:hypothetical protein